IENQHVRLELRVLAASVLAGVGFADDADIAVGLEEQPEAGADDRVIVCKQHADHAASVAATSGISAESSTPCGERLRTSKRPRSASTRSASPRKPKRPGRGKSAGRPTPSSATVTTIRSSFPSTSISTRE